MATSAEHLTVAAVDLGSNSFHVVIGRFLDPELQIVDRVREQVMLADGLDDDDRLTEEAQQRALTCLERIGQRLRVLPTVRVRAVGTNTLRRAKNAQVFRSLAEQRLGHPIEIISGQEEARLIFLGVARGEFSGTPRLVADIGGGSTEIMLGQGNQVTRSHSLFMGCVNYSKAFFPDGVLKKEDFREAEIAARLELRSIEREIRDTGWEVCLGASGTINAVQDILRAAEWTDGPITRSGLKKLRRAMLEAGNVADLNLPALKRERAKVLPGGLAILRSIFKGLEIDAMSAASGALREGVLHDLVGRIRHEDIRDQTIGRMVERYHVDLGQATRVEHTALELLGQVEAEWDRDTERIRKLIVWASRLHEIGLAISHTGFHKHGAYLIQHSYMPGFSSDEQTMLAAIVRGHRRKISRSLFAGLSASQAQTATRLCVVLRLAVLLNRSRVPQVVPSLVVATKGSAIELTFPPGWAEEHPLTSADLAREASYLRALDIELRIAGVRS